MGGKVWTSLEELIFWKIIVPQSRAYAGADRDSKLEHGELREWDDLVETFTQLVLEALREKYGTEDVEALRTYSGLMLYEHWFQNGKKGKSSPNARQYVAEYRALAEKTQKVELLNPNIPAERRAKKKSVNGAASKVTAAARRSKKKKTRAAAAANTTGPSSVRPIAPSSGTSAAVVAGPAATPATSAQEQANYTFAPETQGFAPNGYYQTQAQAHGPAYARAPANYPVSSLIHHHHHQQQQQPMVPRAPYNQPHHPQALASFTQAQAQPRAQTQAPFTLMPLAQSRAQPGSSLPRLPALQPQPRYLTGYGQVAGANLQAP